MRTGERRIAGVAFAGALVACAFFALQATVTSARGAGVAAVAAEPATDILLAFDTTGSMGPSIEAAKRDATTILDAVDAFAPNSRFAVASFRDRFYPGGSYSLLAPMTESHDALVAAMQKLRSVDTTNPAQGTPAEAYNLLFRKSYTDTRIGWRPAARKLVVVIGDAEPHSAGADGLPGCADRTADWDGLNTARELAAMRAARRTLVMIRQAQTASVSLGCYSTLASRAYEGGAARDGGASDIATPVLSLVKQTFAPFAVTPQLASGVTGKTNGLTIRIANPNGFPLTVEDVNVRLPAGMTLVSRKLTGNLPRPNVVEGTLAWSATTIPAYAVLAGHAVVRLGPGVRGSVSGRLRAKLPTGKLVTSTSVSEVRAVRTPRRVVISVDGRLGTSRSVAGSASPALGSKAGRRSGRIVARLGGGRSVTLGAVAATAPLRGAPTRLVVRLSVVSRVALPSCQPGTAGTLAIVDFDALTARGRTADRVRLFLPRSCGGRLAFADVSASGRTTVKVAFR